MVVRAARLLIATEDCWRLIEATELDHRAHEVRVLQSASSSTESAAASAQMGWQWEAQVILALPITVGPIAWGRGRVLGGWSRFLSRAHTPQSTIGTACAAAIRSINQGDARLKGGVP